MMRVVVHHAVSLDGYSANTDGYPVIVDAPGFDHGQSSHGIPEFMASCSAIVMGRTTFDPAVTNSWWPWPNLDVLVLTSRPMPTQELPSRVDAFATPQQLVDELRRRDYDKVELLGGPSTISAMLALDAVDALRILVVPVLAGGGQPFSPASPARRLQLDDRTVYDGGTVALDYTLVR